ncbi:uncharacterized protein RHTO_01795 [Rhodotorula toruloides NP11]|uniref:Uncharacterized protein n=1 Tax=Rhodotorula toruloides (strain NP11) TaxID=1130832 RepID=M7XC42_RHOT1|nr:uncharacterized protein RHTO_01795 [Rhodotorula toruloides NP11]EMS21329.1 hypothetical protein RHTO_01795 [Rhodotorula toruloides NP11]
MPPIRSRPIPPDTAVNPQKLVHCFRAAQDALFARAAHYANLRDKEGAARIGLLMVGLQEWIDTWWNEHLFHIDVRIRSSEPPFASNRALRYNFCTWWLLNETQQAEIVEWLTDLSRSIRRGEFDRADTLPPFKDLRLATPIYAVRERDAGTPQGQLSTRLGTASVTKAMNWDDRFWERRIQGDGVYGQVVPPVTRFSWRKVAQVLMSTHDRVTQEGLSIENFVSWGQEWWTQLFQAHEGKPYLALWFCLTVQQQGDVVDFLKTRCDHLRTHGEQALVNPSRYVALQQAVAYRLACRLLSILHPWHSTSRIRALTSPRSAASDQHALIKTTSEGYDHEPPMPACLASSAHSLGSSLLNNFSHRQRAIYAF